MKEKVLDVHKVDVHLELTHAHIAKVKAEYPFADENTFVTYPVAPEVRARFDQVREDFVKTNGSIRILNDDNADVMSVWALPSQHAALKKLLGELGSLGIMNLSPAGVEELDRAQLFLARATWSLPVIHRGLLYIAQHEPDMDGNAPRLICYDFRK